MTVHSPHCISPCAVAPKPLGTDCELLTGKTQDLFTHSVNNSKPHDNVILCLVALLEVMQ